MPEPVREIVALDFETADPGRDSACALGLVRIAGGEVTDRFETLIRPPRPQIFYTHIHGLTWADVADALADGIDITKGLLAPKRPKPARAHLTNVESFLTDV